MISTMVFCINKVPNEQRFLEKKILVENEFYYKRNKPGNDLVSSKTFTINLDYTEKTTISYIQC
jgi:hypothetical protein